MSRRERDWNGNGYETGGGRANGSNGGPSSAGSHLNKVFVGNLSWDATEESLRDFAEGEGVDVVRVQVLKDKVTLKPRGFAFVTVGHATTIEAAVEAMDGKEFMGRRLTCNRAVPRPARVG